MAIVPNGLPAWTRTASHTNYGGHVNKRNYLTRGVIDSLTDVGAEALCRIAADLEAISRVTPFCSITYLCNDGAPAAPTIEVVYMMTGVRSSSYAGDAAPTGFPSAARNGNGDVTFTLLSTYADAYGIDGTFAPKHAVGSVHGTSAAEPVFVISGQTVRVRAFNGASALSDKRISIDIW
jgi:hypothetical protein